MFGSSQDRARQLAGRSRRERISSISSCSSSRSMSLSSRLHHPRATPPAQVPTVDPTATVEESASSINADTSINPIASSIETYTVNGAFTPLSVPHVAEGLDRLPAEQHRIQAEHLSRVLHNNLSLTNVADLPQSQFTLPRHTRYGSLGAHSITLQHPRSITAPVPTALLPDPKLEDLLAMLYTTIVPPLRVSVSDHHLKTGPAVSLRGGSGGYVCPKGYSDDHTELDISGRDGPQDSDTPEQSAIWALERHILKCMSPIDYVSYAAACRQETFWFEGTGISQMWPRIEQAAWELPITVGLYYNTFLQSLSTTDLSVFVKLFGPLPVLNYKTVSESSITKREMARLAFFHGLGHAGRMMFCSIISERINWATGSLVLPVRSDITKPPIQTKHLFVTARLFVELILSPSLNAVSCIPLGRACVTSDR
jgi:DCN1-like protein 1/2